MNAEDKEKCMSHIVALERVLFENFGEFSTLDTRMKEDNHLKNKVNAVLFAIKLAREFNSYASEVPEYIEHTGYISW